MCDYSLECVQSRPAKVGEKLRIQRFNLGTRGFASPDDCKTAVCVLPGTELAFADSVTCYGRAGLLGWKPKVSFAELVRMMIEHDLEMARQEKTLRDAGHSTGLRGTGHE